MIEKPEVVSSLESCLLRGIISRPCFKLVNTYCNLLRVIFYGHLVFIEPVMWGTNQVEGLISMLRNLGKDRTKEGKLSFY